MPSHVKMHPPPAEPRFVFDADARHKLLRTLYGTLCFAIFFSFVGTVLGGLWADDSWGRFWGWDPKEVWALVSLLVYMTILHGRLKGAANALWDFLARHAPSPNPVP